MEHGIDTSYANGVIDWKAVKKYGISFAYMRACYGDILADDDENFESNHDAAKAEGILTGAYFFFLADHDPIAQANHFLKRIAGREGNLRPCIDVEEGSFHPGWRGAAGPNVAALAAVSGTIQRALGLLPVIYTNADTWTTYFAGTNTFSGHPLWVAAYSNAPGFPDIPPGWNTWAIHQYSDHGKVDGVDGTLDLDVAPHLESVKR